MARKGLLERERDVAVPELPRRDVHREHRRCRGGEVAPRGRLGTRRVQHPPAEVRDDAALLGGTGSPSAWVSAQDQR